METKEVKVGDVLIYVPDYGKPPVTVNVSKVTKTGMIRVMLPNAADGEKSVESELFKRGWAGKLASYCWELRERSHRSPRLYPSSLETMAALMAEHAAAEKHKAEKEAKAKSDEEAREARLAEELAAVKAAVDGDYRPFIAYRDPELSVVVIRLPVRPDRRERKGPVELVVIKLKPIKRYDFCSGEERDTVEGYLTLTNKDSSSWSSWSSIYGATKEEAIWNCLRAAYHNGW